MNADWILSDFTTVIPAHAGSTTSRPGRWQFVEYTTDTVSGILAMANPDTGAPDIAIDLPMEGEVEIHIGMHENFCDRIQLKLARERAFLRLRHGPVGDQAAIQQVFWRRVKIEKGDRLLIRQEGGYRASIAYVMARQAEPQAEHPREFQVHITDDGFPSNWGKARDAADATWQASGYPLLDIDGVSYGTNIVGMANYPTRHPELRLPLAELLLCTFPRPVYRQAIEIMQRDRESGLNVPARIAQLNRAQGIRTFAYARMAHSHCPPPYDALRSPFFDAHPEYRCRDRDGTTVSRLSMAWPEVRQQFIRLFQECVEWGADGVDNVFVRGLPLVLYEEPLLEAFRAAHGEAATEVAEDDPRLLGMRAEIVTLYMRELRAALPEGTPIVATVPATPRLCMTFALDLKSWIDEGLIDILRPYRWGEGAADVPLEMQGFADLVAGSPVKLLPVINTWRDKQGLDLLRNAISLTAWPVSGFTVWDGLGHAPDAHRAIRALHSRAAMDEALVELEEGPTRHILRTYDGMRHDNYNFGWIL